MHINPNNKVERNWTATGLQTGAVIIGIALIALGYLHMRGNLPLERGNPWALLKNVNSWALMGPGVGLVGAVALYQLFSGIKNKNTPSSPASHPNSVSAAVSQDIEQDGQLWNMPDLPLLKILEYAYPEDRARLAATCQKFRRFIINENRYFLEAIPPYLLSQLHECDLAYSLFVLLKRHRLDHRFYSIKALPESVFLNTDWGEIWLNVRRLELWKYTSPWREQCQALYHRVPQIYKRSRYYPLGDGRMALFDKFDSKEIYNYGDDEYYSVPWPIIRIYNPSLEEVCCFRIPASCSDHFSLFSLQNGKIASWYANKIRIWNARGKELLCLDFPHKLALVKELDDHRLIFVTDIGRRYPNCINGEGGGYICEFDMNKPNKFPKDDSIYTKFLTFFGA